MKTLYLFCIITMVANLLTAQQSYFLSQPTLSPSADKVVFCYEGDIWIANTSGGAATRLTAMSGNETNPRISPDSKWLAFTGRQYNNADVYIMPMEGGPIQQLTFHSSNDEMNNWAWDSKSVYITSTRTGQISSYSLPITGGTPTRVLGEFFFQFDHLLMPHPTSGEMFFNDTWESSNQVQRKRYKGSFNPDVQSYNLNTKAFKKYTTWEGKDFAATIDKSGNIYYLSDNETGQYNLYQNNAGKNVALTKFTTSIKNAQVNANGGTIVFEKDYQLWLYDVQKKDSKKLNITISRNFILDKQNDFDVKGNIDAFDISIDGKKLAFVSRGELFVSDIEGKFVQHINRNSTERVKEVKWLADNKTMLFTQTKNGYTNLYTMPANGSAALKELTKQNKNIRNLVFNKKRTKAVYYAGSDQVMVMDLANFTTSNTIKQELWAFQNSNPSFSPNDEYILFTGRRNFEEEVFVHQLKTNTTLNITNTDITETDPIWSPDGKYIYFSSQRLKPGYPFGLSSAHVYRLPLEKYDEPFRTEKYNALFAVEKKDSSKKADMPKAIEIDMEKIMDRIELIGPSFGAQFVGYIHQKGDKTNVLYVSNHDEGRSALWKTTMEPFETSKTEKIVGTDGVFGFDLVESSDKLYVLASGTIHKLNLDGNKAEAITFGHTFRKNLEGEFAQMFEEAWAQMAEGFYDEKMHGVDWVALKKYYQQFIPQLNNRNDLRILLNDMLGELNASHQGFNTFGNDEDLKMTNRTIETGIVWNNKNPYVVGYVLARSAADRKGVDIKPGDRLVKVNDVTVDPTKDRSYYFTVPSIDREIKLTFERNGTAFTSLLHTQSSLANNLNDEWIDNNQKTVDTKSKNSIAYGYMKDMGTGELEQFIIDMTQELNNKKALILDLRYNRGGNVHNDVLQFLSQRNYLNWKYRDGNLSTQPNFTPSDKPIVLLINEQSLSDAEMTAQGFKQMKLGTIVGNETYRWIIFTSGIRLVDGSNVRMPAWGCYTMDGKNLEFTGVAPDVKVINTFTDKINGKDPQLDKAIEILMEKIK